jgi:hypothetical protein
MEEIVARDGNRSADTGIFHHCGYRKYLLYFCAADLVFASRRDRARA